MNGELKNSTCQLCGLTTEITTYSVTPAGNSDNEIAVCLGCLTELEKNEPYSCY